MTAILAALKPALTSKCLLTPTAQHRIVIVTRLLVPGAGFINSQGFLEHLSRRGTLFLMYYMLLFSTCLTGTTDADMVMLANFGTSAGERTETHLQALAAAAGLKMLGVLLPGPLGR